MPDNLPENDPWKGADRFNWNRAHFPVEQLVPYLGKWIAWAPDGSRVVDADEDLVTLCNRLRDRGEEVTDFHFEDLPPPGHEGYV